LFSPAKEKLERIQVANENQFFESLQAIVRALDQEELNKVFHTWVQRVQEVSGGNRDYVG
jgi:hypothetical protein